MSLRKKITEAFSRKKLREYEEQPQVQEKGHMHPKKELTSDIVYSLLTDEWKSCPQLRRELSSQGYNILGLDNTMYGWLRSYVQEDLVEEQMACPSENLQGVPLLQYRLRFAKTQTPQILSDLQEDDSQPYFGSSLSAKE